MSQTVAQFMKPPETRYVDVGEAQVAYQVVGDGPVDLLFCYGLGSHIERFWDHPAVVEFLTRLASFSRLIFFDRRGTGASDSIPLKAVPTWEEWTEDIVAVLAGAGSERAAVMGMLDAGGMAVLFAASHPEMVSSLILFNAFARYLEADDYPIGRSPEVADSLVALLEATWGKPESASLINPSMSGDEEWARYHAQTARSSSTPRSAGAQFAYISRRDVREALALIQSPTLVLSVKENPFVPIEHGRYLADHIEGATFIELPGADLSPTPANSRLVDEVAEFLTGQRPVVEVERVLATVLFTDIVGSTKQAASLGDQRWRSLLDAHDRAVREQLRRFRGREINTTGDGFVAAFDGPARAIRCTQAIAEATGELGVALRMGLHTGECEVRDDDLGGLSVHIAARVGALATPGEVLVSGTVKDLVVGSGIEFEERGEHELKGVPGSWRLFSVKG